MNMPQAQYVSAEFLQKLKDELRDLKTNKRRELADRIEQAKALGDLSENAEYHEAKDALGFVEGRILEIEDLLKNAVIIEEEKGGTNVRVGCTVKVRVNGKEKTFHIVGSNEADPAAGKISNESPIGSALIGAKVGDTVSVRTPTGSNEYEVIEIN
jgi:transcription elongation factor GreA